MNIPKGFLRSFALAIIVTAPLRIVLADSNPAHVEASIPFASRGGIRDWSADGDRGLWVQAVNRKWYYAQFMGRCTGLAFATALGFDTHQSAFDRWSAVVVPGYSRCTLTSLTPSEGPPRKGSKQSDKIRTDGASEAPALARSAEEGDLKEITLHGVLNASESVDD
jgi:Family of unknown function (DUF6491)